VKVQELLLRAPDETVSRLRSLGLADDDIATAIATFEMLPPSDIRGAGPAKLSFKTVIDEKLKLRTVSHSINVGSTLYRGLRLLCSEVNDDWPMQVRNDPRRPKGGTVSHASKEGGSRSAALAIDRFTYSRDDPKSLGQVSQAAAESLSDVGDPEDSEVPIERNTARPIAIPSPVPSAATGHRCLAQPMYFGSSLEPTRASASEAASMNLSEGLSEEELCAPDISAAFPAEHAPLVLAPELNSHTGPDVLQPWPVGHTQQRADGRFWSSTDLYMTTVDPTFADTVLGVGSGSVHPQDDPALNIPARGPSWLLHEARPSMQDSNGENVESAFGGFHGYNEKEFTEQWAEGEPFLDERIIAFARSCGVCCNTTIRWAVPEDAEALVAVNKVRRSYVCSSLQKTVITYFAHLLFR
jgi:hypothetical protein